MPKEELETIVLSLIEQNGEATIRAVSEACKRIAEKSEAELDGTSRDVWICAGSMIGEAADHLERN
jgi:hypothetical protein